MPTRELSGFNLLAQRPPPAEGPGCAVEVTQGIHRHRLGREGSQKCTADRKPAHHKELLPLRQLGKHDSLNNRPDPSDQCTADHTPGIQAPPVKAQHHRGHRPDRQPHDDPAPEVIDVLGCNAHPQPHNDHTSGRQIRGGNQFPVTCFRTHEELVDILYKQGSRGINLAGQIRHGCRQHRHKKQSLEAGGNGVGDYAGKNPLGIHDPLIAHQRQGFHPILPQS